MFDRIVVPLDGSDVAERALDAAANLAQELDTPIHLLRVTDLPHADITAMYGYMADSSVMAEKMQSEVVLAREYLAENVRSLEEQGLRVSAQVEVGMPAAAIVNSVRAGDCIVMASHGRSGISRWYLGSVAEQVMRQSPVPVMVVRSPQASSPAGANGKVAPAS